MPEYTRDNPGKWLQLYFAIRNVDRAFRQIVLVDLSLLVTVVWVVVCSLALSFRSGLVDPITVSTPWLSRISSGLGPVSPSVILTLIGLGFLAESAQAFVLQLHRPSPEGLAEVRERVWHRFSGWYGLSLSNSLLIKSTRIEPHMEWSTWLGGPTFLIILDGFAVYLERGNRFSRVVGSGFPIPCLTARETIKAVVDLRPQICMTSVNAWTNDGIKVSLKVRVEFQIAPPAPNGGKLMYPFDPEAVRKAVEFTAVRLREGKPEESTWCDGTIGSIKGLIAHHLSSHQLDELFMKNDGGGQILSPAVMNALMESINRHLKEKAGVRLMSIQATEITIPTEVRHQRLNVWSAKKDSLVTRIHGEAQAYKIRGFEEARAKAQRDLIVAIAKSLGAVDPAHFPDEPLLLSLSGILDQGLRDPLVHAYMARGTLDALKKLKDLL